MASAVGSRIYTGPWINWTHGLIVGSTITLSSRDGALFTSFLAAFITVIGSRLWKILMFIIHQSRARRGPRGGLHYQQQNVFRNSESPGGAAWIFLQQSYAWRTRASALRSLPWAAFCLLYLSVFAILSVFSGQVTKSAGDMRLIRSPNCGYWRLKDTDMGRVATMNTFRAKNLNDSTAAASYSRDCYGGSPDTLECGTMAASSIPYTFDQNATCPFGDEMCLMSNTAAFQINATVDSHSLLGINAPKHHRVKYHKVTTCAPLHTKGFVDVKNVTESGSEGYQGDTIVHYNYGPVLNEAFQTNFSTNATYTYNKHQIIDNIGYAVDVTQFVTTPSVNSNWKPIPPLLKTNGDVSLVFISFNAIRFDEPCYDPVFRATTELSSVTHQGEAIKWYDTDYIVSVIGCVDQHSICNPNRGGLCTPLGGASDFLNFSTDVHYGFSPKQQGAVARIANQAPYTEVQASIMGRGASALRAQDTVEQLDQAPLSDTHWMDEVTGWFTTGLAHLQRGVLEYAKGPTNVGAGTYIWQPADPVSQAMCRNQLVRSTEGTISFSLLGVVVILVAGGSLVLLSFVLEPVVGWVQRRWKKGEYRRVSWMLDDKLQLQRALYQERGWGTWEEGSLESSVPVCGKGEKFGGRAGGGIVGGAEGKGGVPEEVGLMGPLRKAETHVQVREDSSSR